MNPRTSLRVCQWLAKINMWMMVFNVVSCLIFLLADENVILPVLGVLLNIAVIYSSEMCANFIKKVYGLDDKGNFSFSNNDIDPPNAA